MPSVITSLYSFQKLKQQMKPIKRVIDNTRGWKIWHGLNYFIGGATFLIGSIFVFPLFENYMNAPLVYAWLYTIGSITLLLADFTQLLHYIKPQYIDYRYIALALNICLNVMASLLYTIGSIFFIPQLNLSNEGMTLFIVGSLILTIAQMWKLSRTMFKQEGTIIQNIRQQFNLVLVDSMVLLGGLAYLVGTFIFEQTPSLPYLIIPSAWLYTIGGLFFFIPGVYIQKRYFWKTNVLPLDLNGENLVELNN